MKKRIVVLAVIVALAGSFVFWKDISKMMLPPRKVKAIKEEHKEMDEPTQDVSIKKIWDLPSQLKEVSGIFYLDADRFACIQDEEGTIFIYNCSSKKIEKEIHFAGAGDFEGITVNGHTAYVVRADGVIYEVDMSQSSGISKAYTTFFNAENNIEGLCFDSLNNRLLLGVKDRDPNDGGSKGIYAFDLATKTLEEEPVFRIRLDDPALAGIGGKKKEGFRPSAIGIHPASGDLYITDGTRSLLMTMDQKGNIKKLYRLGQQFTQPEGVTFSPAGEVFISNEGAKGSGNIIAISLTKP